MSVMQSGDGAIIGLFRAGKGQQSCQMDIFILLWVFRWKPWGRLQVSCSFTSEAPLPGLPLTLLREGHRREDGAGKRLPWKVCDDLAAKPQRGEEELARDEKAQFIKSLTKPNLQARSAFSLTGSAFFLTQGPVTNLLASTSNRDLKPWWN